MSKYSETLKPLVEKAQNSPNIEIYWQRYNFPDTPPVAGSEAEKRLMELADEYVRLSLDMKSQVNSSARRARLHNLMSGMIFGVDRDKISSEQAQAIADFASFLISGQSLEKAWQEVENCRK